MMIHFSSTLHCPFSQLQIYRFLQTWVLFFFFEGFDQPKILYIVIEIPFSLAVKLPGI